MIYMDEEFYQQLRDEYCGICLSCFAVKWGDTEPDAENYECEECQKSRVQGIDNLLVMGILNFEIADGRAPFARTKNRQTGQITEKPLKI